MKNLRFVTVGFASALAAAAIVSCGKKDEPAPAAQAPAATTTTTTTTTLPPEPTPVPTPPPVWREARWGMKKAEVLAAFPKEAQRLPAPVPFAKPQERSTVKAGSGEVAIPSYDADGANFKVLFGFAGDALDRVHLAAQKPTAGTCEDQQKALIARYGEPTQRSQTGSSLKGEELVWSRPDQTIVLGCGGVASLGFVTVTLDHLVPAASTAP